MQSRLTGERLTPQVVAGEACPCGEHGFRFRLLVAPSWIVQCVDCGLLRTWPRPSDETLAAAYRGYAPHQPSSPASHGTGWRRVWVPPPVSHGSRILELGAASGRFAAWAARERGWSVTTVDGLGHAEAFMAAPRSFDAVVGWQVLEHTLDPVRVLDNAFRLTRHHGALVLSVPNAASLERWLFCQTWADWDLPRHLWHFTPRTLRALVERSGFIVERIAHQRMFKGVRPPWFGALLGCGVAAIHRAGRITLVAKRP